MPTSSKPVRGTRDYLPAEVRLRTYLRNTIVDTYEAAGFERITTPMLESTERLLKSDGGENLNMIFKILKRGEKLKLDVPDLTEDQLCDMGLRYDLTMPLVRYYANNRNDLPDPFKCIQVDQVFRAERPQHGRLREFFQCDIDIIGDPTCNAEIELIHTTATALRRIGFDDFVVRINDRRILHDLIVGCGFDEADVPGVCIVFDKLDKVGLDGVRAELAGKGYSPSAVERFMTFISDDAVDSLDHVRALVSDTSVVDDLAGVIAASERLGDGRLSIVYDKSLVRGMGYYTGMVFEVSSPRFNSSIAGGGRYDNMAGTFLKQSVPAVGFSIGFERIFSILSEQGFQMPDPPRRRALLYAPDADFVEVVAKADELRGEGVRVCTVRKAKKLGRQLYHLGQSGFDDAYLFEEGELRTLDEE